MITVAALLFVLIGVACAAIALFVGATLLVEWRDGSARRSRGTDGLRA